MGVNLSSNWLTEGRQLINFKSSIQAPDDLEFLVRIAFKNKRK